MRSRRSIFATPCSNRARPANGKKSLQAKRRNQSECKFHCIRLEIAKKVNRYTAMKRLNVGLGLVSAIALSAAAVLAADPDISKLPAPAAKKGVTFDKDVKPLVEKSCLGCHTGEKPKA